MSSKERRTPALIPASDEKRPTQLPEIGPLRPTEWQLEISSYDLGRDFILRWNGYFVQVDAKGVEMGISPRRSPERSLSGWKLEISRREETWGIEVRTTVRYCSDSTLQEQHLVDNLWCLRSGSLRQIETNVAIVELYSGPVAIIPVPRALEPRGQGEGGVIVATHDSLHHGPSIKEIGKFLRLRSWR